MDYEFYTMSEVEKILKIDRSTIRKQIKLGNFQVYRPGRKFLFSKEQIHNFLNKILA